MSQERDLIGKTILGSSKDFIRETIQKELLEELSILRIKQQARNIIEIVGNHKIKLLIIQMNKRTL